jgi:thioredoxin 2
LKLIQPKAISKTKDGGLTMAGSPVHVVCPSCSAVNRIPPDRPAAQAKCGTCHHPLFQGKPVTANAAMFERQITRDDTPVLVDFWAPWCGPCLAMAPAYERAAAELEPRFRLLKLNTEEEPALAERYNIRSIPTLMLLAVAARSRGGPGPATPVALLSGQRADRRPATGRPRALTSRCVTQARSRGRPATAIRHRVQCRVS